MVTTGGFYVLMLPLLKQCLCISAGIFYSLLCLISFVSGLFATCLDPTDTAVSAQLHPTLQNAHIDLSSLQQSCSICKTRVHDYSKHCGQCNRCVEGFDHHCKWLNNCVGKRNYAYFAVLIWSASAVLAVEIGLGVYVLQMVTRDEGKQRLEEVYGVHRGQIAAFTGLLGLIVVCLCLCFFPLLRLVVLQLYLRRRGISTYEYHLLTRQRK